MEKALAKIFNIAQDRFLLLREPPCSQLPKNNKTEHNITWFPESGILKSESASQVATGIADKVAALVIMVQKWNYTRVDKGNNHGPVPNSSKD